MTIRPFSGLRARMQGLLPSLARAYLGFALRTTRWRFVGPQSGRAMLTQSPTPDSGKSGAIVAFWHHSLLLLPALWLWARRRNAALRLNVLISRNRDGRFISSVVAPWDIIGIEGSSNKGSQDKGGARALRAGVRALNAGCLLAVTPDGPRGPALKAQEGVSALARISGRSIVPIGAACRVGRLGTWDRMRIPLPFGRGFLCFATPLPDRTMTDAFAGKITQTDIRANHFYAAGKLNLLDVVWALTGRVLQPFIKVHVNRRVLRGKEEPHRIHERSGRASAARPSGDVIWFHAASVGEARAILPFVTRLLNHWQGISVLLTTATVTGAETVARHRNTMAGADIERLIHQYAPYDIAPWIRAFLAHWRPLALLLTDSEIWPGWIRACIGQGISVGILNGRLSDRSFRRWRALPFVSHAIFARISVVCARHAEDASRFEKLGAPRVVIAGDLKQAAPPLQFDADELEALRMRTGGRPIFVAASTHPGEEEIILKAAAQCAKQMPGLLTIIIPRHPQRGAGIAETISPPPPRRSLSAYPGQSDSIWIVDTLGEMGLFYQLADMIFIGHSLISPGGGHNPYEALHSGAALASGPLIGNFAEAYAYLGERVTVTPTAEALATWITKGASRNMDAAHQGDVVHNDEAGFERLSNLLLEQISAITGL